MDSSNPKQLVESLHSTTCPACKGEKQKANTFCRNCYFSLPHRLRTRLYDKLGSGYDHAFNAAMKFLQVKDEP